MKKSRFLRKAPAKEEVALQITSMADIFTILLVFLLKSFSTGISEITPSNSLVLPEAKVTDEVKEMLKVEISPNVILLDDQPITQLQQFKFEATDVESDGTSRSLNSALIKQKTTRDQSAKGNQEAVENNQKLMILADEKTPYSTIRGVMAAAGNTGFTDFKLVVVKDE